jgi:hypothetical protein
MKNKVRDSYDWWDSEHEFTDQMPADEHNKWDSKIPF